MKLKLKIEYDSPQDLLAILMAYVLELARGNPDPQVPGIEAQGGDGGGPG